MVPFQDPNSEYAQFMGINARWLKDKTLWISSFIDEESSNSIISSLLYLRNESSKGSTIKLYLNIPGALLRPSLAIFDVITEIKAAGIEVETTNLALCAGMGAIIAGSGTKGKRNVMPNARFLLQKTGIDSVFQGQASDIALEVRNVKKWNEKTLGELANLTGQSIERIEADLKRDFYLSSEEAVRYGICDNVLLPKPSKRRSPVGVDLGNFASETDQRVTGTTEERRGANPGGGGDDDDGPPIGKA